MHARKQKQRNKANDISEVREKGAKTTTAHNKTHKKKKINKNFFESYIRYDSGEKERGRERDLDNLNNFQRHHAYGCLNKHIENL